MNVDGPNWKRMYELTQEDWLAACKQIDTLEEDLIEIDLLFAEAVETMKKMIVADPVQRQALADDFFERWRP